MPFNSVNLSADLLKAGDLSPVKAEVSQSSANHCVNHSERADESSQTPRDNASHRERERDFLVDQDGKKERRRGYMRSRLESGGKKRNELKMTVNHL